MRQDKEETLQNISATFISLLFFITTVTLALIYLSEMVNVIGNFLVGIYCLFFAITVVLSVMLYNKLTIDDIDEDVFLMILTVYIGLGFTLIFATTISWLILPLWIIIAWIIREIHLYAK